MKPEFTIASDWLQMPIVCWLGMSSCPRNVSQEWLHSHCSVQSILQLLVFLSFVCSVHILPLDEVIHKALC